MCTHILEAWALVQRLIAQEAKFPGSQPPWPLGGVKLETDFLGPVLQGDMPAPKSRGLCMPV